MVKTRITGIAARDPYVLEHKGKYYRCFTEDFVSVSVACGDTLEELFGAEGKRVYIAEEGKEYSKQYWAPELHIVDDKCYIHVACDDGENANHRMYVLKNHSDNPMDAYEMHGKIQEKNDKWAIDGTMMEYQGERYYIWSGWEGDVNCCQSLYIAKMDSPYTLSTQRVMISTPDHDWEKLGCKGDDIAPNINEGACALTVNGKQYLTYSASGSWCENYCIAILELTGDDPLNPKAWSKWEKPILSQNQWVKGAGHCSLLQDEDGIHVFFHGWEAEETQIRWDTVYLWHGKLEQTKDGFVIV